MKKLSHHLIQQQQKLPLSYGQLTFWMIYTLTKETANHLIRLKLDGPLQYVAIEQALNAQLAAHSGLRASLNDWWAGQQIEAMTLFHLPFTDLSSQEDGQVKEKIKQIYEMMTHQPYSMEKPPLFRAHLIGLAPQEHILLIGMPHFVIDGAALHYFQKQIWHFYHQYSKKGYIQDECLKLNLADYLQKERAQSNFDYQSTEAFWQTFLNQVEPTAIESKWLDLEDRARRTVNFRLSKSEFEGLEEITRKEKATLQMIFFSLVAKSLQSLSNNKKICLYSVQENRALPGSEAVMATLLASLPIVCDLNQSNTMLSLLHQMKDNLLKAYEYRFEPWSIPAAVIATKYLSSRRQKMPWWLKFINRMSSLYHRLFPELQLYPSVIADFAKMSYESVITEKAASRKQPYHVQVNINYLPGMYKASSQFLAQETPLKVSNLQDQSIGIEVSPDYSKWEQNAINFYIESEPDSGQARVRIAHQCLGEKAESQLLQAMSESLQQLLYEQNRVRSEADVFQPQVIENSRRTM